MDIKDKENAPRTFITPLSSIITEKLTTISTRSFGNVKPTIINLEVIRNAIAEYKQENQIYTEITIAHCVEIALSFKRILKISNLDNLLKLEKLKLDNNMIMKIENLDHLENLKWLDLSFNQIKKIEGLENLYNLKDLSLYHNKISVVEGLDKNKKINILSIGKNEISDHKKTVDYLQKFSNLQALTISGNPFYKEDTSVNNTNFSNNDNYPPEYDVFYAKLEYLKYLDYRPINHERKQMIIDRLQHQGGKDKKGDDFKLIEEAEKREFEERIQLKEANIDSIQTLIPEIKKIMAETNKFFDPLGPPIFVEKFNSMINEFRVELDKYKKLILEKNERKIQIIREKKREIEKSLEFFVEKSKNLIHEYKINFKAYFKNLTDKKEKLTLNREELDAKLGLTALRDKLYEIESHLKYNMTNQTGKIKLFEEALKVVNSEMMNATNDTKSNMDAKRKEFKEEIKKIYTDILDRYAKNPNEADPVDKFVDDNIEDIRLDLDKLFESIDDKILNFKDQIDQSRNKAHEEFFKEINDNEYTRNRKRIEDINEIYNFYLELLEKQIKKFDQKKSD